MFTIIMKFIKALVWTVLTILKGTTDSPKGIKAIFNYDEIIELRTKYSPIRENLKKQNPTPSKKQPKVLKRTIQCYALNGGACWFSIIFFEYFVLPIMQQIFIMTFGRTGEWTSTSRLLSWIFSGLWVLPLWLISKFVNYLWFQDIANSAYRYTRGRPHTILSISKFLADNVFSICIQIGFLLQIVLVGYIPYLGSILGNVHLALLYSLYVFEYKWVNMGWELHKRLTFIENNWPYFMGFSLPLAFATSLPSSYVVSGCVFSILFPIYIISGNEAEPTINNMNIPPLRLFTPVIIISNYIFNNTIGTNAV